MIILIPNTSCKTDEYTFQHSLIQIVWKEKDAKKAIHKCFYIFVDLFSDLLSKWRNLIFWAFDSSNKGLHNHFLSIMFYISQFVKTTISAKLLWTYLASWQFCVPSNDSKTAVSHVFLLERQIELDIEGQRDKFTLKGQLALCIRVPPFWLRPPDDDLDVVFVEAVLPCLRLWSVRKERNNLQSTTTKSFLEENGNLENFSIFCVFILGLKICSYKPFVVFKITHAFTFEKS